MKLPKPKLLPDGYEPTRLGKHKVKPGVKYRINQRRKIFEMRTYYCFRCGTKFTTDASKISFNIVSCPECGHEMLG